jgi:hypothetical protein
MRFCDRWWVTHYCTAGCHRTTWLVPCKGRLKCLVCGKLYESRPPSKVAAE